MAQYRMGPPKALVLALRELGKVDEFVETGTYRGDTAAWAAEHFGRVSTIELSPAFYQAATQRFANEPKLRVLAGESSTVLREIVPALTRPALFWLDAHWSGLDTAGRAEECPLMAELALINASLLPHIVLVDDARLFCSPPPRPHRADQWPDLMTVLSALHDAGRRHVLLADDVFIAVPTVLRDAVIGWMQDETTRTRAGEPRGRLGRWWKKVSQ